MDFLTALDQDVEITIKPEKLPECPRIRPETWGCWIPGIRPACVWVRPRSLIRRWISSEL